ncbi:hypothetical protein F0726_01662 [Acidithiobacillus caldus]|nr:hypothetical protein F0726_01662 [Acidithiobacillus caldus]
MVPPEGPARIIVLQSLNFVELFFWKAYKMRAGQETPSGKAARACKPKT